MRTFKFILEYDGTDFNGWQVQTNAKRTVQGEFEAVLLKIFKRRVTAVGSGRTDSGVHARGQVAHIRVETDMPPDEIMRACNYNLPRDIVVCAVSVASSKFHAQLSARRKTYSYVILNRDFSSALERRTSYFVPRKISVSRMRAAAKFLVGRKDFCSFANVDPYHRGGAVRTISRLDIKKRNGRITITVEANGFLYKMVRNIVGTLLEVGTGRFKPEAVRGMLLKKDRRAAGLAAPAHGLCLEHVIYK
ncbi:MAG: tRNA pseudouridine(38-40) synthase TruA [Candidatus Omnitrophica bacterium]|nr:tRNA pseudouridine(38-40) synthase TruA [Candidatus Omnitrophota bacterium]